MSMISVELSTCTFLVDEVARLSELNRRLQQKLQVLGEERAQLNCELSELEDDDDSSPEMDEDVKASDPAPQPAQQGGWNKVVSKRTKKRNRRRNRKTQKKPRASSRSYAQAAKSPPPVAARPVTPIVANVAERKMEEPIPVVQGSSSYNNDPFSEFILDECGVCNGPADGYICHGFRTNTGQVIRVPVASDPQCPVCRRDGHPVCSSCYQNGGAAGLIDKWIVE